MAAGHACETDLEPPLLQLLSKVPHVPLAHDVVGFGGDEQNRRPGSGRIPR
jgi:hypothetical protein